MTPTNKSAAAYELIRERILRLEYQPGSVLNQAAVAAELGISTTPLREALRRLESEELVELRRHSDARIAGLSAEEARDLVELRYALDPLAVALAAERRTRADIAAIRAAEEGMRALPDSPSVEQLVAHRRFHQALYRASHNEMLIATLDGLWDKSDRYRLVGLQQSRTQEERDARTDEHRQLLEAVSAGDADAAAATMRHHIGHSLGAKAASRLAREGTVERVDVA
jgi:DNA-binding GntR family transcriptional regulator